MSTDTPSFPNGWKVFPCHAGTKKPIHDGWPQLATDDPVQIAAWATEFPGCNWAVACGPSGLAVLDIDPPLGEQSLFEFELAEGFLPATRELRSARGGRHLIFQGDIANSVGRLGPTLDTRGQNGYIIIPPSTFEGAPYVITEDRPLAPLPASIPAALGRLREAVAASTGVELDSDIARGRAAGLLHGYVERGHVAVQGEGGDARTYAVAAEVLNLGLSPDIAFELIDTIWNIACIPPWDGKELMTKVANAAAYAQNDAGAWAVPPAAERIPREALDKLLADSAKQREERARFAWMDEDEFSTMPEPEWLIKDMLTRESIAMMFGPSGHYKSFIALNIAAHIAQSGDLAFYVAAEGISRMARKDFPAWKAAYGEDRRLPFYMVEDMPLTAMPGDLDEFADSIKREAHGRRIGLIVLDTLNNAMLGLEENSAKDVGQFIAACKALKRTFNCTVMIVHHTKKDGTDERGSGALYAGFDTVLKVIADKAVKLVRLHVTKQKTAEERPFPFCYEGKRYGAGLAFTPIDLREAAILSDEGNIYGSRSISAALVKLKAFQPITVSSAVLLMQLVPQLENETEDQRKTSLERAAKGLHAAIKGGKIEGYYEGLGKGIKWSLPAQPA